MSWCSHGVDFALFLSLPSASAENTERESKENQWMGVTVNSQGPGGKIVVRLFILVSEHQQTTHYYEQRFKNFFRSTQICQRNQISRNALCHNVNRRKLQSTEKCSDKKEKSWILTSLFN